MSNKNAQYVKNMFAGVANRYDLANHVLSLGVCCYWQEKLLARLPASTNGHCLDLCTGTGAFLPGLCKRFSHVTGADFCKEMLDVARKRYSEKYVGCLTLEVADALDLPYQDASFDVVTVAYGVRNFSDLRQGLAECCRVLKPGGQILILEFGKPTGVMAIFYNFYSKYLMPVIGRLITGKKEAYEYLPETAGSFYSGEEFIEQLSQCGFKNCLYKRMFPGVAYLYQAYKSVS